MGDSRTKNIMVNTGYGIVMRISNLIVRFLLQTVLVYTLGVQYTGVSGLFTSIFTVLSLAELGVGNAVSYALYKPLAERDELKISAIMKFFANAYRYIALGVLSLGIAIIPILGFIVKDVPDIKENIVLIYLLYVLKTVASYLLIYKSTLLVADQQNYLISSVQTKMNFLRTAVECVLLILLKNFIIYLFVEIAANIIQNIYISHLANKRYPILKKRVAQQLNRQEKDEIYKNVKAIALYKASHAIGAGVDNIIVSVFVNTVTVGLLSNYLLIKEQLLQILNQFFEALTPSVGNYVVEERGDKQEALFTELLFLDFWISTFCSVSYFVIIQPFITWWLGKDFLLSIAVAAVIAIDFFLGCMLNIVATFRTANGLFVKCKYRPLIMTILNVVLSILFGYKWGVFGVFFATVVSRLATQWYDSWILYKYAFKKTSKPFFVNYYSYFIIAIIIAGLTFYIGGCVTINSLFFEILWKVFVCLVVPNVLIFVLYRKTERYKLCKKRFVSILKKLRGKLVRG